MSMLAKKSLGQNFLMHPRIAERIARTAQLTPDSVVLEIGPGTGMLTRELLKLARKVIAVEADEVLYEKLKIDFEKEISEDRLELIYGDIRNFFSAFPTKVGPFRGLKGPTFVGMPYHVVANIPYYLTGEIFRMFLEADQQPSSMTLLVQKEVADRVVARDDKASILSLSIKAYGTPKREFLVPRGAFIPAPNVDSAVLTIRDISRKNFKTKESEETFFKCIHAGFAHKRKFVRRNLTAAGLSYAELSYESIPEKARAEDLPLSMWLNLSSDITRINL